MMRRLLDWFRRRRVPPLRSLLADYIQTFNEPRRYYRQP